MPRKQKDRLISILLNRALFDNEKDALAAVMAGDVQVRGRTPKAGEMIDVTEEIHVRSRLPYAGKGALKLGHALDAFSIDLKGRVCVDAGASTGGFTDCLVRRGAALVYAVDTGFGQLAGYLRQDERVVNLERTNIGDSALKDLSPRPTLGTVDLSYLSLTKAVPQFADILHGEGELVCLVKPLFEIDDPEARRTGIVPDDAYLPLLTGLVRYMNSLNGVRALGVTHSPVTGNNGTREFFMHLGLGVGEGPNEAVLEDEAAVAVSRALSLAEYKK